MVLGTLSQTFLAWARLIMSHCHTTVLVNYQEGTVVWTISSQEPEAQAEIPGLLRGLMNALAQRVANFFKVTITITETDEHLKRD